jgi:hypothetical protein
VEVVSEKMDPELRDFYLRNLPRDVWSAMQRIYKMGDASFQLRDKIAVDELFTFVAQQQERIDNLEETGRG